MKKTTYSVEFKKNVVSAILTARAGNPEFNTVAFIRENYPELSAKIKSVYNWVRALAETIGKKLGMSINEVYNKTGNAANELSLEQKRQLLEQVESIDEDKRGLYLCEHGLYQSDIDTWKQELCVQQALNDSEQRHQEEIAAKLAAQNFFYEKKMQKMQEALNVSSDANTKYQQEIAQYKTALNKLEANEKSTQARLNKSYQTISKLAAALQLSENF